MRSVIRYALFHFAPGLRRMERTTRPSVDVLPMLAAIAAVMTATSSKSSVRSSSTAPATAAGWAAGAEGAAAGAWAWAAFSFDRFPTG